MKRLWGHIGKCKDQRCQVSHCISSRHIILHYQQCRDEKCQVCIPVRHAIKRQQLKRRQREQLRREHDKKLKAEQMKLRKRTAHLCESLTTPQLELLFKSLRTNFNPFYTISLMQQSFMPIIKFILDQDMLSK